MKGLPPALRKKKRYIAFELILDTPVEQREFVNCLINTALSVFGELTSLGLRLEHFDGRFGILRCYRDALDQTKFVLNLIDKVGESRTIVRILGVSGTIKRCKKKYIPSG